MGWLACPWEEHAFPPLVIRDVEAFPHLEVEVPFLPELSVGSKGAVGPTDSVVSSNQDDSCI